MAKKKIHPEQEHPVDKVFREGLEQRQFAYEDRYWEEAERTISSFNENRRKVRYAWWLGGAAVLFLLISVYFVFRPGTSNYFAADKDTPVTSSTGVSADTDNDATQIVTEPKEPSNSNAEQISTPATGATVASKENPPALNTAEQSAPQSGNTTAEKADPSALNNPSITQTEKTFAINQPTGREPRTQTTEEILPDDTVFIPMSAAFAGAITQGARPPSDYGKPRLTWQLGIYAGTQRSFPVVSGGPSDWANYRNEREREAFSPNISIEGSVLIPRFPLGLQAGVTFMQLGEDATFDLIGTSVDTSWTIDMDTVTFIGPDSIPYDSIIIDTAFTYYAEDTLLTRSASNRFYYLEIPVSFGYTFHVDNWHFHILTGPSVGILQKRAGYYPNDAMNAYDALEDVDYFKKAIWFWRVAPAVSYSLSPNMELYVRGQLRKQLSNMYLADDRTLKYWTHGVQLGLNYTFR